MKRYLAAGAVVLMLAGCTEQAEPQPGTSAPTATPHITEVEVQLRQGDRVRCLLWDAGSGYDSGMSCDWEHVTSR